MFSLPRWQNRLPVCSLSLILSAFLAFEVCAAPPRVVGELLQQHCAACHEGKDAEAGLDVNQLTPDLNERVDSETWVRIIDRVAAGEMPPEDADELSDKDRQTIVSELGEWVRNSELQRFSKLGRVRGRRLTNLQLERTLQDLLGIDIPLSRQMPDEPRTDGFTTVAHGQSMSHFQLQQHLRVVDNALDEAFQRALTPKDTWSRTLPAKQLARKNPRRRTREPEIIDGHAVTWNGGVAYYGRLPATTAWKDGWYRFTIRAKALNKPQDEGVWCSIRSGRCVSSAPLLSWVGAFEATDSHREVTVECWMPRGHMLEIRPADATLRRARFRGGQVGAGEGAPQNVVGIAIERVEMERFHPNTDDHIRKLLFGNLELSIPERSSRAAGFGGRAAEAERGSVQSTSPKEDAAELIAAFAQRAFRRPTDPETVAPYIELAYESLDSGASCIAALRGSYRAILCSPRFLYLHELPGKLDDFALASRMSYMLWGGPPDASLLAVAEEGRLSDHEIYRQQIERMLADSRGDSFVEDLAAQWLDLSLIDFTTPDRRLYPGFDLVVQYSMLDETHAFLRRMLADNEPVTKIIDSDTTYLNSRLAKHYRIKGVDGDELRSIALEPDDHRGGLLTQGSIMKVTANGTTTSPVIRGVWVSERLLGREIPPPPSNVPAIEPDIRGAKSIREQLAKHKSDAACASCHTKIDPPGFALENFDPAGRWRDAYGVPGRGRNNRTPIDASFQLPDGRPFKDLQEFKQLVMEAPTPLAHNVAEKLLTYGTGAPVSFADRQPLAEIVEQAATDEYGFRSLLIAVMESPVFQSK